MMLICWMLIPAGWSVTAEQWLNIMVQLGAKPPFQIVRTFIRSQLLILQVLGSEDVMVGFGIIMAQVGLCIRIPAMNGGMPWKRWLMMIFGQWEEKGPLLIMTAVHGMIPLVRRQVRI